MAAAAAEGLKEAQEKGDQEEIEKFAKRTVRITKDQVNDVKKLLQLMGMPIVEVRTAPTRHSCSAAGYRHLARLRLSARSSVEGRRSIELGLCYVS